MFTIDTEKLEKVTAIINQNSDPAVTEDIVEAHICADWQEGHEHQQWLNTASPAEIADWVASTVYAE